MCKSALQEWKCIAANQDKLTSNQIGGDPAYPAHHIKLADEDLDDKARKYA
ncbi:MAG TPA: hypothetical protein GX398_06205 [Candidatus Cloacimonetes bacterium]|nr:hypothetical protein [Candidatus Cloacimonadota bacterium]